MINVVFHVGRESSGFGYRQKNAVDKPRSDIVRHQLFKDLYQ